ADTLPTSGAVRRFIHARGRTPQDLLAALAEACGVDDIAAVDSPGKLLERLLHHTEPITVIVDALDEAVGSGEDRCRGGSPVLEQVVEPLVSAAARTPLRLLLGTRAHLIDAVGQPAQLLDLDHADYADRDSVRRYARSCLTELVETSPYRGRDPAYLD